MHLAMTMSDYTISIPDTLYEKAWRLAQQTAQSVEDVIRTRLEDALDQPLLDLTANERAELRPCHIFQTIRLTIARE